VGQGIAIAPTGETRVLLVELGQFGGLVVQAL
jgi:hypothetical protein